jgi:hypothetical protein
LFQLAIIASAIESRKLLLHRAIQTWLNDALNSSIHVTIRIFSEGWDATELCQQYLSNCIDWQVQSGEPSGSHIAGYNYWWRHTLAEKYLFTHPEILFPAGTLKTATQIESNTFGAFKVFWMPQHMTENIEMYPWKSPELLECYDDLYTHDPKQHSIDYWNRDIRSITQWLSTTTHVMDKDTTHKLYTLPDFHVYGPDDGFQLVKRHQLKIREMTIMDPILFHQWHPSLQSLHPEEISRLAETALKS